MLAKSPAPHSVRQQLLSMIHDHMKRLNDELKQSNHEQKAALTLSSQELITVALDEEEKFAKENAALYQNVIKLRIVKLKKMKLFEWVQEQIKWLHSRLPSVSSSPPPKKANEERIETGLTSPEEVTFLTHLFVNQRKLDTYGYVIKMPTESEVEQARQGVEAAKGWEVCDRCRSRFQIFPGRRAEDGALTSGGQCRYHPGKPRRPLPIEGIDNKSRDSVFTCCNENVGSSSGCTVAPHHVFKVSDPKRLALVMPFLKTPPGPTSPAQAPKTPVAFDCEMCYTTKGLELVRLTATSWPDGQILVDVLCRPLGEILDLNSRFSGVWPEEFTRAIPYDPTQDKEGDSSTIKFSRSNPPRIVPSPAHARALLFRHLEPSTPLIGHALDNDLNAARIIHPSIIDTVCLYPHPRGLPLRNGLKYLMKKHLDRDIQMGGAETGHDSAEDARAAGELVRLKVATKWAAWKNEGWTLKEGEFVRPPAGFVKKGRLPTL